MFRKFLAATALAAASAPAAAQTTLQAAGDTGDTAWILTSSAPRLAQ